MLKGFTDASDSKCGLDWDLWIWAPIECAVDEDDDDQDFVITTVEEFPFSGGDGYEIGYNIFVELQDSAVNQNLFS